MWIRTQHNIPDALERDKKSTSLQELLRTLLLKTPVQQLIDQSPISNYEKPFACKLSFYLVLRSSSASIMTNEHLDLKVI